MDAGLFSCLANDVSTVATEAERDIAKLPETFMNIDVFVTSVEDVSNTKLSCSEKDEVAKSHNFEGDAEMFRCLTIDVVFTVVAKTERVALSDTVIAGSIVTTVENVENTELFGLEKEQVVVEVTMSDVTRNHGVTMLNVIDRKGDNFREVTVDNTSNVEVVNDKGGNIQSLLTGTFGFRMALQSRATFRRRSIRRRLGNTFKSSVMLITAKLFFLKSIAMTHGCVVNNQSTVFKDRSLQSKRPMKGSSIQVSALKRTNTNKLNAKRNIFKNQLSSGCFEVKLSRYHKIAFFIHGDVC